MTVPGLVADMHAHFRIQMNAWDVEETSGETTRYTTARSDTAGMQEEWSLTGHVQGVFLGSPEITMHTHWNLESANGQKPAQEAK